MRCPKEKEYGDDSCKLCEWSWLCASHADENTDVTGDNYPNISNQTCEELKEIAKLREENASIISEEDIIDLLLDLEAFNYRARKT